MYKIEVCTNLIYDKVTQAKDRPLNLVHLLSRAISKQSTRMDELIFFVSYYTCALHIKIFFHFVKYFSLIDYKSSDVYL